MKAITVLCVVLCSPFPESTCHDFLKPLKKRKRFCYCGLNMALLSEQDFRRNELFLIPSLSWDVLF